ncbi:hypothetical protein RDV89_01055 [Nocardioides zeae]|uniref:Uncharacterized protein n=1 Tax=Nocardioides imazamoxiresistens TaxID=3231893 RepID=A0ABU3PQY1_9ACTN|nr:hypothetical protein [Nocardioides zeae]MDT9591635.1 hypothetical protein [Nocardioides zeae]
MDPLTVGRDALRRRAPEVVEAFEHVEGVAADSVEPATLAMVRDRVAALLDLPAPAPDDALDGARAASIDSWHSSPAFDERDRAVLAFVEQFVFSVSSMGDAEVDALLVDRSPAQVHELANAVWAVDLGARVDHVAGVVLG